MAKERLTKMANIGTTAREIDFVTRFAAQWDALIEIMGISRPIRKQPGTALKYKFGTVVLQDSVSEGEEIPYSLATVGEKTLGEITLEKYSKAVSAEAIAKYGYDVACAKTDDAFRVSLTNKVMHRFFNFANSGELTDIETTFQMALAMAKGLVTARWQAMNLDITEVVAFVNTLDFYEYLGAANITVQTQYGLQYVKDFMGYRTVFLFDDTKVARGHVIATPVENIIFYYTDPSDSDFAKAGLNYTVEGVTNLIGFHVEGNYNTAVSENHALMGIDIFAEYLNGIAVVKVETSGSTAALTVASAEGTAEGTTAITITQAKAQGGLYYYKASATETAPTAPSYKAPVDNTWTAWDGVSAIALDKTTYDGKKITIVETNGAGQTIASGSATLDIA